MKKKYLFCFGLLTIITLLFYISACSKDKSPSGGGNEPGPNGNECSSVEAKFSTNILPIIQNSCALSGCHGTGSSNGPGPLTNYAQISAAKSAIIDAAVNNSRMPKTGGPLSAAQKQMIKCWVNSGASNN